MSSLEDLLGFARALQKKTPSAHDRPNEWMLMALDFSQACLQGGDVRPVYAESIPLMQRGPFRRAVEFLQLLSSSYDRDRAARLPETFETIFKILEEAQARPAGRGAWRRTDPGELDQLLPIAGRKAFDRDLAEALKEILDVEPLSLLMSDVDHFKQINDHYGHAPGDEALKVVARLHDSVSRGRGKAYRLGGEEMAILLPNCTEAEAVATVERLRAAVARETVPALSRAVTVSIGVSTTYTADIDATAFYQEGDEAMYRAKEAGRNRVEPRHPEAMTSPRVDAPASLTAQPTPPHGSLPPGCPPDIPADVFQAVRSKAEAEWPDNYAMRQYAEARQLAAYRQMYQRG